MFYLALAFKLHMSGQIAAEDMIELLMLSKMVSRKVDLKNQLDHCHADDVEDLGCDVASSTSGSPYINISSPGKDARSAHTIAITREKRRF